MKLGVVLILSVFSRAATSNKTVLEQSAKRITFILVLTHSV